MQTFWNACRTEPLAGAGRDALPRVRRCLSRRVLCRLCHARSRVPIVFGPFHYCAFCERATPDAPETIDHRRRCTRHDHRTCCRGSRGSASLPCHTLRKRVEMCDAGSRRSRPYQSQRHRLIKAPFTPKASCSPYAHVAAPIQDYSV